jgi:Cu(I)/Ag(I) efflux system membrane fusion protein
MRVFVILLLLLAFAVPVAAADEGGRKALYWYDPMVPGQKFDKPGKSPYMDMELVPFYADQAGGDNNAIQIDASYRQALGVKTAPAQMQEFGKAIHAFGTITPETRREYIVAVRTGGWITDLNADAVGDTVKKGDLLFTFYSPDLLSAQADYLVGQRGGKVVGDPDKRLRLYGMDDKAIAALKEKGSFIEQTPFYAPTDGTVTTLNVRKGSYIDPQASGNATVLTLQDFSQVWIIASVPVKNLQFLSTGTPAIVAVDETGQSFNAVADFIYPMTDMESREGMVRLVVDNPDGKLKTGSLVNIMFEAQSQKRLAVPAESVLYGKDGGHVIENLGNGTFRPVKVETGITAHGLTEIVSGLKEGQSIVTSGQFMIDAESNLRGGLNNMKGDMEAGHAQ